MTIVPKVNHEGSKAQKRVRFSSPWVRARLPLDWRRMLALLFLLALLLRLLFIFPFPQPENHIGDSVEFDLLARNLLAGHGLSYKPPWEPSARRTPLYPWLLALTYRVFGLGVYTPLLVLQAGLDALLVVVLAWLARWAWHDARLGLLAAAMWAFYLPGAQLAARLLADAIFTFLQMGSFFLMVLALRHQGKRAWVYAAAAGGSLGFATLARPTSLYMPLLWGLALVLWWGWERRVRPALPPKHRLRMWIIGVLMMGMVVAPWFVRNYRAFGRVVMGSTLVGFNFFQTHYRLDQPDFWKLPGVTPTLQAIHALADAQGLDLNEAELFQMGMAYGMAQVKAHPARFLALSGLRVLQLWFNLGFTWHPSLATWLFAAGNLLLLLLACVGEMQAIRARDRLFGASHNVALFIHATALLVLLYYTASHAVVIAAGRYIIPAIPFLILCAAGAPWAWFSRGQVSKSAKMV